MVHDPDLLDRLEALQKETFDGEVFRGTRQSLDPLASSYSGGRWMRRDGAAVLYTSLAREGALAEISFHWGQLTPRPTKPVMLHTLRVAAHRTWWNCDNLILFPDGMGVDAILEIVRSEAFDWVTWATAHGLIA